MKPVRIGTRGSSLARWQTNHVAARLRALDGAHAIDVVRITSVGDQSPDLPIDHLEGTGFFTSTIERALELGEIDVAVHSCKDLPVESAPDLTIAALLERAAVEDVLCARDRLTLSHLPAGARVGTCSLRRTAQLRAMRPDLDYRPLRGNLPTRIERVTAGELDAVVIARAGLERLGLMAHASEIFTIAQVLPAPAQGAIAVQARRDDADLVALLERLDHRETRRAVEAERALLHGLGGGCSVPVGALARTTGATIRLDAAVFDLATGEALRTRNDGREPEAVAAAAARALLDLGAGAILEAAARTRGVAEVGR